MLIWGISVTRSQNTELLGEKKLKFLDSRKVVSLPPSDVIISGIKWMKRDDQNIISIKCLT